MRSQHRAPLVAYALVAIAGLVVILQTLSPEALSLHRVPQSLVGAGDFQVTDPVAPVVPQPTKPVSVAGSPGAAVPGLGVGTEPAAATPPRTGPSERSTTTAQPKHTKRAPSAAPDPVGTVPGKGAGGVPQSPDPAGPSSAPHFLIPPILGYPGIQVPAIWPLVPQDEQEPPGQVVSVLVQEIVKPGDKKQETKTVEGVRTSSTRSALKKSDSADDQGAQQGQTAGAAPGAEASTGPKVATRAESPTTQSEPSETATDDTGAAAPATAATCAASSTESALPDGSSTPAAGVSDDEMMPTLGNILKAARGLTAAAPTESGAATNDPTKSGTATRDVGKDAADAPCADACVTNTTSSSTVTAGKQAKHHRLKAHRRTATAAESSAPTDLPSATLDPQACASTKAAHEDHSTATSHHARK